MSDGGLRVFELPDVGEGLSEARVESVLVEVGQTVDSLQPILEVETDKSVVELTSPWAGEVARILVEPDTWVDVGQELIEIRVDGA